MLVMRMTVLMFVRMVMRMIVMLMSVMVAVFVGMLMAVVCMRVVMLMREVDIKFYASDGKLLPARNMEMPAVELELLQLAFELGRIHAEVEQRGDEHVAGDAADEVEVKCFHSGETSAFIWLAA